MTPIRLYIYLAICLLMLPGCEKGDEFTSEPRANFEALWRILDENYCFFSYKEIDWDEVHERYSQQVKDTMDQYVLFDLMADMLYELKDGHTNLVSSFDMSRYWEWYENYPSNYSETLEAKYLGKEYRIAGGMRYTVLLPDSIGYVAYRSFSSGVGEGNLNQIFLSFKDCRGLILDIRENGGGSLTYSDRIATRFLKAKTLVGYMQHKTGKGHDDFSEPYPLYLEPSEYIKWWRPVVVLTNRHCYSAANDFVQKMRMAPYATILGDKTGGGSGFPFMSELPNGWMIRFSASPMLDVDKQHTEFGIAPDIPVALSEADEEQGFDTLIERARQLIVKQTEKAELGTF
ncbi:MAG: S41 family peptidase [Parabacteroides sp.]